MGHCTELFRLAVDLCHDLIQSGNAGAALFECRGYRSIVIQKNVPKCTDSRHTHCFITCLLFGDKNEQAVGVRAYLCRVSAVSKLGCACAGTYTISRVLFCQPVAVCYRGAILRTEYGGRKCRGLGNRRVCLVWSYRHSNLVGAARVAVDAIRFPGQKRGPPNQHRYADLYCSVTVMRLYVHNATYAGLDNSVCTDDLFPAWSVVH